VTLRLFGAGGRVIQGKVTRNSRSLNPQSRTLRIEIDLPNKDGKLLPGMYVHAAIQVRHDDAWTLPATALATDGDNTYCYRCENGKAVRTPLQIGLRGTGVVEVLKEQTKMPSGSFAWQDVKGADEIVANAATVSEGQTIR
jgi:membrane fusion protein (multidrug efflux system)